MPCPEPAAVRAIPGKSFNPGQNRRWRCSWQTSAGWTMAAAGIVGLVFGVILPENRILAVGLQTGLLYPIPPVYRSISLVVLPLLVPKGETIVVVGGLLTGGRSLCSCPCPVRLAPPVLLPVCLSLGGAAGDHGQVVAVPDGTAGQGRRRLCTRCGRCDHHCEGACTLAGQIQWAECLLCYNCPGDCPEGILGVAVTPSTTGERPGPDLSRRAILAAGAGGAVFLPLVRLGDPLGVGWRPRVFCR